MTAGTPIPGGVLTVDDDPNAWGRFYILDASGWCVGEVTDKQRARLLAGPPRPDGVPDDAVPLTIWFTPDDRDGMTRGYAPDGGEITLGFSLGKTWRYRGVPVPPYQPTPDPVGRPETVAEHFNGHCCADDPECEHSFMEDAELERHMRSAYQPAPDPADSPTDPHYEAAARFVRNWTEPATVPPLPAGERPAESQVAQPPSERTGPLGLSEAHTREIATNPNIAIKAACRAAVAEWDAEPQPVETLADTASTIVEYGGGGYTLRDYWNAPHAGPLNGEWIDKPHRLLYDLLREIERLHVEAATRPDPDTITVNDLRSLATDWQANANAMGGNMGAVKRACAVELLATFAAGLPQEPTTARPRPTLEEQRAHLDEGSCGCHDSWDQCPCAEGGHPADGSCNCCPLGTGLCGPLPQEPTEGGES